MTDYFEAIPLNGDVTHAIEARAGQEPALIYPGHGRDTHTGRYAVRALCGVRGRDSWGYGGMVLRVEAGQWVPFTATDPNPTGNTGWDGRTINKHCPRCISKIRAAHRKEPR